MNSKSINYNDVVEEMNSSIMNEDFSQEEKKLFLDLRNIIKVDLHNKVMVSEFLNDERTKRLIDEINGKIAEYENELATYKYKTRNYYNDIKYGELENKLKKLTELKKEILSYSGFVNDNSNIISRCVGALAGDNFNLASFFGKTLVYKDSPKKFNYRSDYVDVVYSIINDSNMMSQLEEGVILKNKFDEVSKKISSINNSMEFRPVIFQNAYEIIKYNEIRKKISELNSKIEDCNKFNIDAQLDNISNIISNYEKNAFSNLTHKKELDILYHKKRELTKLRRKRNYYSREKNQLLYELSVLKGKLSENGLDTIIKQVEINELLNKKDVNSLANNFTKFNSIEDIDNYYSHIDDEYDSLKEEYNSLILRCKDFEKITDSKVLLLLSDYFDTSFNIVELKNGKRKNGILPVNALKVLETLNVIENTKLDDLDISSCELDRMKSSSYGLISNDINKFFKQYDGIISQKNSAYSK